MVGIPFSDPEFPRKTVDLIDRWVGFVRDRTTKPVVSLVRAIVFGTIVLVVSISLVVVALIGLVRGTQVLFELFLSERRAVWATYFSLGGLFLLVGALLMRARHSSNSTEG